MEESPSTTVLDGEIIGIKFALANRQEICTASISDCPISHASQLGNPFLGLPLEHGKCESCGTAEPGKCEGHFGYIELPIPIYHPCHISELKRLLSLLCLKCLKMKTSKFPSKRNGLSERLLSSCCEDASQISIKEEKPADGACFLQLKLPSRTRVRDGFWNFLERYGYRYSDTDSLSRILLPSEVMEILKKIPDDTRNKLIKKGYFPQDGYILQYLPIPPNCLSVPDVSDGVSIMSSDPSVTMLKKVLKQVEIIKSSRSGTPTFEAHEVEANDLQCAVEQYLQVRGTVKAPRDMDKRFGIHKEPNDSSNKAWLEKIKKLFISKGSGFSSRTVITGDAYKGINEIGLPFEIAQRITFEEKVNVHNMKYLQELVDNKSCLTYRDGLSTYSLREGSKGHTSLRSGQVVHRRIVDGDTVFINRPPTTHKHSLQALSVYIHEDHTVKINPLICGPLNADFDGDCIHLFYPQSLAAKAEVLELFSVEKQLPSSHSGSLNLQLVTDSLLSLKKMFRTYFLDRTAAQQLAMFVSVSLPQPALFKANCSGPHWTALQILETALPGSFDCYGERHLIAKSNILKFDLNRDVMQSLISEVVTSLFIEKGPKEVLNFFNALQPLLMEYLFSEGFSVGLEDFSVPMDVIQHLQKDIQHVSPLLYHLRSVYNEVVEKRLENELRLIKVPVANFILKSSAMGNLIDSKSESGINKVVQQIGFLGLQLSDQGKFYTRALVEDMAAFFKSKYPFGADYPSGEYGLIKSCFFHGLDPYEEIVHSISSREVIVRSSRGLTEPGTLFKNLMAILRDVVICYDGTVRNVSSNSIIQFEYGVKGGTKAPSLFPAGEPVGVLAATAMSNPAYKAVLDSSPSSNSSWELMKEILLCRVNFKNDPSDRRVILYLNDCGCGRKCCREHAAYIVLNLLQKVSLKDAAVEFLIEYKKQRQLSESSEIGPGLAGHVHLNKELLDKHNISMQDVYHKCQETVNSFRKKKKYGRIMLSVSECCSFQQPFGSKCREMPCLMFYWQDASDYHLEKTSHILANMICPDLLKTTIKGDPRISTVNIIWTSPDTTTWIRNPSKTQKGELVLDIVLEKAAVRQSGDAWRVAMDSCLPVLHLIDTNRSIPYAIKQVQELLGISCAFAQAVQRLSTSVTMVTKGVLKEHLILLANSMTCAGNLVGFNVGGYKALSRSLNVQVPFADATMFTPRKCFERAAEKCHMDSLSSIVASCSWGRQVAVGTGSRFELLWDTKEIANQEAGIDVYNLLHMVRSSPNGEFLNTDCLGADIDDLVLDDDNMELGMSPEHDSGFVKPVFEDSVEFQSSLENQMPDNGIANESAWDRGVSGNAKSNSGGDWAVEKQQSWGGTTTLSKASANEAAWDRIASGNAESNSGQDWAVEKQQSWGGTTSLSKPSANESAWDRIASGKAESNSGEDWAAGKQQSWGGTSSISKASAWGSDKTKTRDNPSSRAAEDFSKSAGWDDTEIQKGPTDSELSAGWGKKVEESDKSGRNEINGQPKVDKVGGSRGWDDKVTHQKPELTSNDWAPSTAESWQQNMAPSKSRTFDNNNNTIKEQESQQPSSQGWDHPKTGGWNDNKVVSQWGEPEVPTVKQDQTETESNQPATSHGWNTPNTGGLNESESQSKWGHLGVPNAKEGYMEISHGWGTPNGGGNENEIQSQWGQHSGFKKNRSENSRGWGPSGSGEWKIKKSRPAGTFTDDSSIGGVFTATRQRLDKFTSEEQQILSDVEPIMHNIRRIMHQSGYNDGDKLSDEDQLYVIDNVFAHHPDKVVKMGTGIDYVMVNKHNKFQDTRCFYVVTTDGHPEDFSSRKCVENFVQGKYPENAESFIKKYFRTPRGNREQSQNPEETGNDNRQQ